MTHDQEYTKEQQRADQEEARTGLISAREKRGLTQEWMAEEAGYSITQYIRIENGERKITGEDLWKFGMALLRYDDALKSPFQRNLTMINREINRILVDVQIFLEDTIPGMDAVFYRLPIRDFVVRVLLWSAVFIYVVMNGITFYDIGFSIGKFIRWIELILS